MRGFQTIVSLLTFLACLHLVSCTESHTITQQEEATANPPVETETAAPVETETAVPVETETAAPVETETAVPVETETAAPVETAPPAPAPSAGPAAEEPVAPAPKGEGPRETGQIVGPPLPPGLQPAAEETSPGAVRAEVNSDAAAQFAEILKSYNAIPTSFHGISKADANVVATKVSTLIDRLEQFLKDFPRSQSACEARFLLARLKMTLEQRMYYTFYKSTKDRDEVKRKMREFHDEIFKLCDGSLACIAKDHPRISEIYKLIGDARTYNSRYVDPPEPEFEKAIQAYRVVLEKYPDFNDNENLYLSVGNAFLELKRTDEGIRITRDAYKKFEDTYYMAFFNQLLWKLYVAAGDIPKMLEHSKETLETFPKRLERPQLDPKELPALQRYLAFSHFRKAKCLWALGESDTALVAFNEARTSLEAMMADLQKTGKAMPELQVYLGRVHWNTNVLENFYGAPPQQDLDSVYWATSKKVHLASSTGKTVAILLRPYNNERSQSFFRGMDEYAGAHQDSVTFAVLANQQGATRSAATQAQDVLSEAAELGIEHAALGLTGAPSDPKHVNKAFGATVGSGTFVILNRNGIYEFAMQDPRTLDIQYAIKILERIAGE